MVRSELTDALDRVLERVHAPDSVAELPIQVDCARVVGEDMRAERAQPHLSGDRLYRSHCSFSVTPAAVALVDDPIAVGPGRRVNFTVLVEPCLTEIGPPRPDR